MQMNIREGIKKFGDKGSEAIIKELISRNPKYDLVQMSN